MLNKTIAYALVSYGVDQSGVHKKILDQISAWKNAGYIVQLFVITDGLGDQKWKELDPCAVVLVDTNLVIKVFNRFKLLKLAARGRQALIYLRDCFPIWIPKTSTPIIIEIQTLVGQELKLRNRVKFILFLFLKRFQYSRISAAIYVTHELLKRNEFGLKEKVAKITIGNGINMSRIEQLPKRAYQNPALFFIGTPNQPWHGIQELVDFGISNPEIEIHIVGGQRYSPHPNIHFHGNIDFEQYKLIASKCIAGVGTLNLKLKAMEEDSSLKVREYLAFGLPVIIRSTDVDLDSDVDYVLKLPIDARAFSDFSHEIIEFLDRWCKRRVPRDRIQHIDSSVKEKIRIGFFEEIATQMKSRANGVSKNEL